jgi:hypothetical protein
LKKGIFILLWSLCWCQNVFSQSIAVGIDTPDPAAIMELESTNKGILIPRLTTAQRDLISGLGVLQEGLMIYNSSTDAFNFWNGTAWLPISTSTSGNWALTGNTGTVDGTNFIGTTDNIPFTVRVFNQKAARINSTGQTFFGYQAGNVNTATTNTGIGFQTLFSNTGGGDNVGVGYWALYHNTTGVLNTASGAGALYSNTIGNYNTAIGSGGMLNNTIGDANTSVGYQAVFSNLDGDYNTGIGYRAMHFNTTGFNNTAVGSDASYVNTTGSYNTAIGNEALTSNTTGNTNTAIGSFALRTNTTASNNVGVGFQSLFANTTGTYNVALGISTLYSNTTGGQNTAVGSFALNANTTAFANSAFGYLALYRNTTGSGNAAFGSYALEDNTTGIGNAAFGNNALTDNTTGNTNSAFGNSALSRNTTGSNNAAFGYFALQDNVSGEENTAFGNRALENLTTGSNNTAVGLSAGDFITTGSNNSLIGNLADTDNANRTNSIVLAGFGNLTLDGDNRVRVGNSSMSSIGGQVGWSTLSDQRIKENIQDDVKGLDFILKLKPLSYNYDIEKSQNLQNVKLDQAWNGKYDIEKIRFSGFLAQEVEAAAKESNYEFSGVDKPQDADGLWGLRYAEFTVPLVKATQELNERDEAFQLLLDELTKSNESLKKMIEMLIENEAKNNAIIEQLQQEIRDLKNPKKE